MIILKSHKNPSVYLPLGCKLLLGRKDIPLVPLICIVSINQGGIAILYIGASDR